jgi:hypothetical protein
VINQVNMPILVGVVVDDTVLRQIRANFGMEEVRLTRRVYLMIGSGALSVVVLSEEDAVA